MTVIADSVKVESRDYIIFFVNGKMQRVVGDAAFLPLSDYLRYQLNACGTKVVCAEGDCGACTVMLARPLDGLADDFQYKTVNSCIQYLFQLDCTSVITVEGMLEDGRLNAVQQAMVECHGAQCGYCTPGSHFAWCRVRANTEKRQLSTLPGQSFCSLSDTFFKFG